MNKSTFISEIRPLLKKRKYCKQGNYWYKLVDSHICCVNVQGSQWDGDDYYVNIGFALQPQKKPTILHWFCCHRCEGEGGEVNPQPHEVCGCVDSVLEKVLETERISVMMAERNAVKVGNQYWF